MSDNNFIKDKLNILHQDKQPGFAPLHEALSEMAKSGEQARKIQIPADGNWFSLSFDAIEQKKDKLVISARRIKDGWKPNKFDPSGKVYTVEFEGTRAAYLVGYFNECHRQYGWPYIYWDIRSYITVPQFPGSRIYVENFFAHAEIKKLIQTLEDKYGTGNVFNSYINDNLKRFQQGIQSQKTPTQIETDWSRGMMESLGFRHVEAFDKGYPAGKWYEVAVHWTKLAQNLRGGMR